MKNKTFIYAAFALFFVISFISISCRQEGGPGPAYCGDCAVVIDDDDFYDDGMDDMDSDCGGFMDDGGFKNSHCNAIVDTSNLANKIITITFDGNNCNGKYYREGTVVLTLKIGSKWSDVGAVVDYEYNNVLIKKNSTNKHYYLNGTRTYTNVLGGYVKSIGTMGGPSRVTHNIVSTNFEVTFEDKTKQTWNVSKTKDYTLDGSTIKLTTTGTGVAGDFTELTTWGTDRKSIPFYVKMSTPTVSTKNCDYFPYSGVKIMYYNGITITKTYGVDATGNSISSGCTNYYLITYTDANGWETKQVMQH